ncbi:MAG: RluA family pseudouridine synthase [Proteobacteria bacterium]|nr:RluA family pseudouridine synthase [Pseudomonadota bacterium]
MKKGAFTLCADIASEGMRLDLFISKALSQQSRSGIAQLIKKGLVQVSGQDCKTGYRIKAGDIVTGFFPPAQPGTYLPEPIPLVIVHEDDHMLVVNKPPGLVVHPAPGHYTGTLVNALLYHCPDLKGIGGEIRPGIVHRLDKDTSGLMVVAKDEKTHQALSTQFKSRLVTKEYLALTHGLWKENSGRIFLPIGRHPSDRKKMSVHSPKGRPSETLWGIENQFHGLSLVRANLKTGRTHQIRVHFAAVHHPIVGDPVYSNPKLISRLSPEIRGVLKDVNRQMLHAKHLAFTHPETKKAMSFDSELPEDMALVMQRLSKIKALKD